MDNKEIVKNTYNKISQQYFDVYYNNLDDKPYYDKFEKLLKKGATILDLGCGNGKTCKYFSELGYKTLGLDFSDEMLKLAKKHSPNLNFKLKDITKFSFDKKFDGAIYAYSLFHLNEEQAESSIQCVSNALNSKSPLLLLLQKGKGEIIEPEPFNPSLQMYCKFYDEKEISELLNKHGFDIEELIVFAEPQEDTALSNETMCVIAIKK